MSTPLEQPERVDGTPDKTGGSSDPPPDQPVDETVNLTIIWFLGLALLALVGTLIGFSISKTTFPDGLTTLASLIVGGLLGVVNPTRTIKRSNAGGGRGILGRSQGAKSQGNAGTSQGNAGTSQGNAGT
jgi:hypothetical protein